MGTQKAAFTHYINRALMLPRTDQARTQEWQDICNIAQQNGFPKKVIQHIKEKEITKLNGRPKKRKRRTNRTHKQ